MRRSWRHRRGDLPRRPRFDPHRSHPREGRYAQACYLADRIARDCRQLADTDLCRPNHQYRAGGRLPDTHWVGSWEGPPEQSSTPNTLGVAAQQSYRMLVHTALGGSVARIRLSNAYGTGPVTFADVHVGLPVGGLPGPAVQDGTNHAVTFGGQASVTVAVGEDVVSDPLPVAVPADGYVAVSFYLPVPPAAPTGHWLAMTTSYLTFDSAFRPARLQLHQRRHRDIDQGLGRRVRSLRCARERDLTPRDPNTRHPRPHASRRNDDARHTSRTQRHTRRDRSRSHLPSQRRGKLRARRRHRCRLRPRRHRRHRPLKLALLI
jgi:hypothetical protein